MDKKIRQLPERVVELSEYVPEFLREYAELQELYHGQEDELKKLYQGIDHLWNVSLLKSAGPDGIRRYEKLLGIASDSRLSLEERRARVLMKWNRQLPYTMRKLVEQLKLWSGEEPFTVDTSGFKQYKLRIEVYNQTVAALRAIKENVDQMIPANLNLFLFGRYPSTYEVPVSYQNAVYFQAAFHPRFNLSYLSLDGTWKLDGNRWLNGYDSNTLLDLYPVQLRISSNISTDLSADTLLHIGTKLGLKVSEEAVIGIRNGMNLVVHTGGQLEYQNQVPEDIKAESRAKFRQHTILQPILKNQTRIQTKAGETGRSSERMTPRIGIKQSIQTVSFMTKMNKVDASWKLDGSRRLDGGLAAL